MTFHPPAPTRRIGIGLLSAAAMTATLWSAPIAGAEPALPQPGSRSASETVDAFQAAGYDVQLNYPQGRPNVPLDECKVTAIRDFNGPMTSIMMLSPVDIDVSCPNAK